MFKLFQSGLYFTCQVNKRKNPKLFGCVRVKQKTFSQQFVTTHNVLRWRRPPLQALALFLYSYLLDCTGPWCPSRRNMFLSTLNQDGHRPSRNSKWQSPNLQFAGIFDGLLAEILPERLIGNFMSSWLLFSSLFCFLKIYWHLIVHVRTVCCVILWINCQICVFFSDFRPQLGPWLSTRGSQCTFGGNHTHCGCHELNSEKLDRIAGHLKDCLFDGFFLQAQY